MLCCCGVVLWQRDQEHERMSSGIEPDAGRVALSWIYLCGFSNLWSCSTDPQGATGTLQRNTSSISVALLP